MLVADGLNWLKVTFITSEAKVCCSICGYQGAFLYHHYGDRSYSLNSSCPQCNSRSRHRGLFFLYQDLLLLLSKESKILHFAPEPIFYSLLRDNSTMHYRTADYFLSDVDYKVDIQKIDIESNMFDLVLCNHVIEHVPDDDKAFSELSRILKPKGCAVITIPGDYRRRDTIYFNHLRFNGHYRDYGLDVVRKLEKYFDKLEVIDLNELYNSNNANGLTHGIKKFEYAFVCHK